MTFIPSWTGSKAKFKKAEGRYKSPITTFCKKPLLQSATSLVCLLSTFVFSGLASAADALVPLCHRHPTQPLPLVQFTSPSSPKAFKETNVDVRIKVDDRADAQSLKVYANNKDVTKLLYAGHCGGLGPCEVTGRLYFGTDLKVGWNYLSATVSTPSGAAGSDRLRVFEDGGVSDPTDGTYGPPYAVHIAMTYANGLEVDYTPETGNQPYYYPGDHPACPAGSLTMIDLNRSTLAWKSTTCYGAEDDTSLQSFLSGLNQTKDLILASTDPGTALGKLNLSPIGGTDFTKTNFTAYGYTIVGYGQGSLGIATESYNTNANDPWRGIEGNLINASADAPLYGFQATDSVGFAMVPNLRSATLTIGNTHNIPVDNSYGSDVPNRIVPNGFTNTTYSSPAVTGNGGGVWLVVLDRHSLQLVSSNTYSAQNEDGSLNTNQMNDLLNNIYNLDNSKLVFLATLVGPNTSGDYGTTPLNTELNQGNQYTNVLQSIIQMGVSPYAFDKVMGMQWGLNNPSSAFSMVGVPRNFLVQFPTQIANNAACDSSKTLLPNNTLVCGGNQDQWFSSALDTQQKEIGALKGSLVRNKAYEYYPTNVASIDSATLESNPTADQLLADNLSRAVGTAPTVPWPLTDTAAGKAAYAYISNLMLSHTFYGGSPCNVGPTCGDIRFWYTGTDTAKIAAIDLTNSDYNYPGDGHGFGPSDWSAVQSQLLHELAYLGNVLAYKAYVEGIQSDENQNLALDLTAAATQVAVDLNKATGQPESNIKADPMTLSIDSLSALGGVTGLIGIAAPPVAVISGIVSSVGGILSIIKDAQKTTVQPDPYVDQLGNLLADQQGKAATAATNFNTDLETATDTFFSGVVSDWFKLQTIGMLSTNPNLVGKGWYSDNPDVAAAAYAPALIAQARKSFYMQTASQYYVTCYVRTQGYSPRLGNGAIPAIFATPNALTQALASNTGLSNAMADYSWEYRDTLPFYDAHGTLWGDGTWDYNFIVLKANQSVTWPNSFGDTLMGPPSAADGTGNLNINRDVLYDSGIFPTINFVIFGD